MTTVDHDLATKNKERVRSSFEDWRRGTGGPFTLLAEDASWTIVGRSTAAGTYRSRKEFLDVVIDPFNARMSKPLRPAVRAVYAEADWVIALFDASAIALDGQPYDNTYTWYLRLLDGAVVEAIAFFDALACNELWERVRPTGG
jgi:ketosteroid isomerase-like protein